MDDNGTNAAAVPHETLIANLQALANVSPGLVERISWPAGDAHVRQTDRGLELLHRQAWHRLSLDEEEVTGLVARARSPIGALVMGVGDGAHVHAMLADSEVVSVTLWERDPWLMRLFLASADLQGPLMAGRLGLVLGADLVDLRPALQRYEAIAHPVLGRVYREELQFGASTAQRTALVCDGGLFVDDVSEAIVEGGRAVYRLDTNVLSLEEMAYTIAKLKPELVAAVNYKEGLAEFCRSQNVPLLSWEIDPTTDGVAPADGSTAGTWIFTYRDSQRSGFSAAGFSQVAYLPLAANPERRRPLELSDEEQTRYGSDVSFLGASMVGPALQYRARLLDGYTQGLGGSAEVRAEVERRLDAALAAQRKDFSRYTLPEAFAEQLGELAPAWAASRIPEDPLMLAAEVAAAEKRLAWVGALGDLGLKVWGDEGWKALDGIGIDYCGAAGHFVEVTKIYNASRVNVDIGRLYQSDIVTMRVFDVLACGGFLLVEHCDAVEELFELGNEIVTYRTVEELRAKVAHYLAHPDEAAAIARRGRERVLADHTIAARVRAMLNAAGL